MRRGGCHPVAVLRAAAFIFTIQKASVRLFRGLLERISRGFMKKLAARNGVYSILLVTIAYFLIEDKGKFLVEDETKL